MARPIFLDHHSTTPVDPRVVEAMLPYFTEFFGNPHSADHRYGWEAQAAVEKARQTVAELVGAQAGDIVFTSGATEANNLALLGAQLGNRRHVVSTSIEHASIDACLAELERRGVSVSIVPVEADGRLAVDRLEGAIRPDTGLISVQTANHEIGTLQPIAEMGAIARRRGILFHTDAAQAAGKIPIDVDAMGVDLLSLSAHKLYGPKGVGALYVANRTAVGLDPILHGGRQERGLRAGTLPVASIVGFGVAAQLSMSERETEQARIEMLRDWLLVRLRQLPGLRVHGSLGFRLAGNLNVGWSHLVAQDLLYLVRDQVAISSGAACSSAELRPSRVLKAIGLSDEAALCGLRIGLGRFTSEVDVDRTANAVLEAATQLAADPGQRMMRCG